MYRLLAAICLTGVAGLFLVGGCTPESENTWSENLSFANVDPRMADMTGTYDITNQIDDRFITLTVFQTGGTLQGYDNMRRTWRGTIDGSSPSGNSSYVHPRLQLETSDGPEGQVVIVANGQIFVDLTGTCYIGIDGHFYSGEKSGWIQGTGPAVVCDL